MNITQRHRRTAFDYPDRIRAAVASHHDTVKGIRFDQLRPEVAEERGREAVATFEQNIATIRGEMTDWIDGIIATCQTDLDTALDVDHAEVAHRSVTLRPVIDEGQTNPRVLLDAFRRYEADLAARKVITDTVDAMQAVGRTDQAFDARWKQELETPSDNVPEAVRTAYTDLADARALHRYIQIIDVWAAQYAKFAAHNGTGNPQGIVTDFRIPAEALAYMQRHGQDIGLPDGAVLANVGRHLPQLTYLDGSTR